MVKCLCWLYNICLISNWNIADTALNTIQSINQSINQSIDQSINRSINRPIDQSSEWPYLIKPRTLSSSEKKSSSLRLIRKSMAVSVGAKKVYRSRSYCRMLSSPRSWKKPNSYIPEWKHSFLRPNIAGQCSIQERNICWYPFRYRLWLKKCRYLLHTLFHTSGIYISVYPLYKHNKTGWREHSRPRKGQEYDCDLYC